MRLIDANVLKAGFEEDGHLTPYIKSYIDACPTVDAVPVTRCKHCECWLEEVNGTVCRFCTYLRQKTQPDDYCLFRKKKKREGEAK